MGWSWGLQLRLHQSYWATTGRGSSRRGSSIGLLLLLLPLRCIPLVLQRQLRLDELLLLLLLLPQHLLLRGLPLPLPRRLLLLLRHAPLHLLHKRQRAARVRLEA